MSASRRADLIAAATTLFEQNGFHATGIDKILARSGAAKMTLYNHFKSKDDLIVAVLEQRDQEYCQWLREQVQATGTSGTDQVLSVFDALEVWLRSDSFHGCLFTCAANEYADQDHPIHLQAAEHKRHIFDLLHELATDAQCADPRGTAQQLLLLYEGAIAVAHALDAPIAARQARRAAAALLAEGA